jgi:putative transposase
MLTPAEVHAGTGTDRLAQRHMIMRAAFQSHPERFVNGAPKRQSLPEAVWINPPSDDLRAA